MIELLSDLNILEILRLGVLGLCFLLSLLAFLLIRIEQQRDRQPRKGILQAIYIFVGTNILVATLVATTTHFRTPDLSEQLTQSRELNVKLKNALTKLSTSIDGKVEYEMEELKNGNIQSPALRVYIRQLNKIIKNAKNAKNEGMIE